MTPSARLSAAIEVLDGIASRRRPSADVLKEWGQTHRFAGSGDRAALASLVYDTLRRRASAAWLMDDESSRAAVAGMLKLVRGMDIETIGGLFSGERFAPTPLTSAERAALTGRSLADAPAHVAGDFPDWLVPSLSQAFGAGLVPEMQALATRAPLYLRVNTLKAERVGVAAELAPFGAEPTPLSPLGLRIPLGPDGRGPSIQSDPCFLRGEVEIQDEGSQLAALWAGAEPGQTIIDLCAGGGGKTLALAAAMGAHGRLVATDGDPRRLAPIHARLERAGAGFVEVRTPRAGNDPIADLDGTADLVVVDAPCTGTGTWRRNPDAKWRIRPGSLAARIKDQAAVLDRAARLVRPGGRIAYITCSVLPDENDGAVAGFLDRAPGFAAARLDPDPTLPDDALRRTAHGVQLTPLRTGTDGFYVAMLGRGQ